MDSSGASSLNWTLLTPFGSLKSKDRGAACAEIAEAPSATAIRNEDTSDVFIGLGKFSVQASWEEARRRRRKLEPASANAAAMLTSGTSTPGTNAARRTG